MITSTTLLCLIIAALSSALVSSSDEWEAKFLVIPDPAIAREHLFYYTSLPHIAGSEGDYQTALYTQQKFIEYGINNTVIEEHKVLLTYPVKRIVESVNPETGETFTAKLKEPSVPQDPTSNDTRAVDTFNGYAPSGNATAQLVYANYGRLQDFQQLQALGVNVSGKIVIVRYGQIFRGVKAMIAQEYGAAGVLIYSDPADDGYGRGQVYPEGPWRPEDGVQRGSVQFLSICPGNPLETEDCLPAGSTANYSGTLIPNIPVQPISWGDALPLLTGITNNPVPATWTGWVGGLNITYGVGPGPIVVHLETEIQFNVTTIWNVIATIDGVDTERSVLFGNHRDAWVFGATDPNSGSSVLLEVARGYGGLLKQGWKPQRNIVFCSWDAEEYGLVGSTAYAKLHKDQLSAGAVAYMNIDVGVSGPIFSAAGTPTLRDLLEGAAASVKYPNSTNNQTMLDHWGTNNLLVLGSGSDYTAFIHHLGIASFDVGFDGNSGGVYHSIYDSFYWMDTFGDPGFIFHQGMAQYLGIVGLRLIDSVVLPHNYTNYANQLDKYAAEIIMLLNSTTDAPDVHMTALLESVSRLTQVGLTTEDLKKSQNLEDKQGLSALNDRLFLTERQLLNPEGLPGRPFFKHVVQAPGLYSGYGANVFPGLYQAIMDKNWDLATAQADIITSRIHAAASTLEGTKPTPSPTPNHKAAIIAGCVVGGVAFIAIIVGVVIFYKKRGQTYIQV